MNSDTEELVRLLAVFAALCFAAVGIGICGAVTSCTSEANGLRLEHSWGPLQGCLVTRRDGVVVNIRNYGRSDRD